MLLGGNELLAPSQSVYLLLELSVCDHLDLQVVQEDGGHDDDAYVSRK